MTYKYAFLGRKEMKKKVIVIFVCLLFLGIHCLIGKSTALQSELPETTGFRVGKVFGIFPSVLEDEITFIMVLPPFGRVTIDQDRFSGHTGIFFIIGQYQWFENGPPALSRWCH